MTGADRRVILPSGGQHAATTAGPATDAQRIPHLRLCRLRADGLRQPASRDVYSARFEHGTYVPDPNRRRRSICEACARQLLARIGREGLPIPRVVHQPDYFERAYAEGADEEDM
jgi:hypothetical protein